MYSLVVKFKNCNLCDKIFTLLFLVIDYLFYIVVDKEDFLILYLLPYVITSQRPKKRNSRTLENNSKENNDRPPKVSLQERRETFILHVQV